MTRAKFRIKRVGRLSVWFGSDYPWRMLCRHCGRRAHHATWTAAMSHAEQHDCAPGSLW